MTNAKKSHPARKLPRQERSKQMVEAILEAAAELFATFGYARTTTNKIALRAGVSIGSLYQYFPNKDSLLASLLEKHHADVSKVVNSSLTRLSDPKVSLKDGLGEFVTNLVELHSADPKLTKALSATVLRESPTAEATSKKKSEDKHLERVSSILSTRPDVRNGDYTTIAAVLGQATSQLTRWMVHDAPANLDQSLLLEETVKMLVNYLKKN